MTKCKIYLSKEDTRTVKILNEYVQHYKRIGTQCELLKILSFFLKRHMAITTFNK